ncbi:tyrosine-type recombinase/integrase [Rubrimonas cliftonensis]|uniref:Site-specific recombinase XerD n=1 Tax=Rubrimonas cliftonensis TaxID=89524 RepID=A0A1H4CW71_9RHOB|nr:tyrosine-type recombinase/integrase [Rubrimonas cliftonensis]SEA64685.1 Site-specific recombinase XerD [Rubrimonas cliftonensis]
MSSTPNDAGQNDPGQNDPGQNDHPGPDDPGPDAAAADAARRRVAALLADRPPALSDAHVAALLAMARETTPDNSARALRSDARAIAAWRRAAVGGDLVFPEAPGVVVAFILDHAADLESRPADDPSRLAAEALVALGRRGGLAAQAPATIGRRLASWRRLHRLKGVDDPFDDPLVRETLRMVRRAGRGRHGRPRKSANAIDRRLLDALYEARPSGLRGVRDAALIEVAWASGGRRRSEMAALRVEDLDRSRFAGTGEIGLRLAGSKTHRGAEAPPPLTVRGRAARCLDLWLRASGVTAGPVFRGLTRGGAGRTVRVLETGVSGEAIRRAVKSALVAAGFDPAHASPHGLRSGFVTEAARRGVPLEAAMRLTLHRSRAQAGAYYQEAGLDRNPATALGAE